MLESKAGDAPPWPLSPPRTEKVCQLNKRKERSLKEMKLENTRRCIVSIKEDKLEKGAPPWPLSQTKYLTGIRVPGGSLFSQLAMGTNTKPTNKTKPPKPPANKHNKTRMHPGDEVKK